MPELGKKMMTRRNLIRGVGVGLFGAAGAAVLAACGETQVIEKIVTREVIKEVPVEKIVTRDVIKEVAVETVVTRDVIKEVPVETVVRTEVIKEVIKEVPVEVEKEVIKEVIKEVVKEVEVEKEVIKEVVVTKEVEVIKEVTAEMMIPEGPLSGGTLTLSASRANTQDIFTPLRAVSSTQGFVFGYVYEPLWIGDTWGMGETPQMSGQWDKALANSWEEVELDRSYVFHLNPDIWWHDRTRVVDADDVLFGMEMAFDPAYNNNKHKTAWGDIEGVKAWADNPTESITDASGVTKIDEMTVQVTIERPDNNWWASGSKVFAMPRHHFAGLDKATATEARAVDLLGNGPMIFERYVTQQFADLTANKDWAYGAPYVDDYIVRYGDGAALDAATEANEQPNPIDFHRAAGGIEAFARLASQAHLRPFPQRSPFASGAFLNQTADVFADMTLEQQSLLIEAMVLAVDREQLNNELHGGTRFISDYIFEHVALLSDPPDGTFRDLFYNPDAARELLAEANWDSNKVIKWMRWSAPQPRDLAIKSFWDEVGIQTEFLIVDGSAVIEKLYQERVHDLVFANMGGDQNPVDACLRICSDRLYELGGWNHSNINRPWIDEAYASIFAAESAEERREVWLEMATRLHARGEMVYGQFSRGSLLNLYHRRVKGAFWMQNYAIPVRSPINLVWIDPHWEER